MNSSKHKQKSKNATSIVAFTRQQQTNHLNVHSSIKQPSKFLQQQNIEYPKEFVHGLISRLCMLQEKQRENELKFHDCLRSLRNQMSIKQKANHALKQEISSLRSQMKVLKADVHKCKKTKQIKAIKHSKIQHYSSKLSSQYSEQKQNVSPYLVESLCLSKNKNKRSLPISKVQQSHPNKLSLIEFRMKDFIVEKGLQYNEHEDYNMAKITTQPSDLQVLERNFSNNRRSAGDNRKHKSKSLGGLLKSRLFAK